MIRTGPVTFQLIQWRYYYKTCGWSATLVAEPSSFCMVQPFVDHKVFTCMLITCCNLILLVDALLFYFYAALGQFKNCNICYDSPCMEVVGCVMQRKESPKEDWWRQDHRRRNMCHAVKPESWILRWKNQEAVSLNFESSTLVSCERTWKKRRI